MEFLVLEEDIKFISERIREIKREKFILILKTKNEVELLEKWIDHYSSIFGLDRILILDNFSDDDYVLDIYNKIEKNVGMIIRFGENGKHDLLHDPHAHPAYKIFYEDIASKCDFFAILDTDEFLVYIENNKIYSGKYLYNKIYEFTENNPDNVLYTFWMNNYPGCFDKFQIGNNYLKIFQGVKNGKFFIPSQYGKELLTGHNSQAPYFLTPSEISTKFWLLHYQSSSLERRIKINYEKINSKGMFKNGIDFKDLCKNPSLNLLIHQKNISCNTYIEQIIAIKESIYAKMNFAKEQECLSIQSEEIKFQDEKIEEVFNRFLNNSIFKEWIKRYFSNKYSYGFRRMPMIDIGVYSQVFIDKNNISGYIIDTIYNDIPEVIIKINNEDLFIIQPKFIKEINNIHYDKPSYFSFDIEDFNLIKSFVKSRGYDGFELNFVFKRTNKKLRNGSKFFYSNDFLESF